MFSFLCHVVSGQHPRSRRHPPAVNTVWAWLSVRMRPLASPSFYGTGRFVDLLPRTSGPYPSMSCLTLLLVSTRKSLLCESSTTFFGQSRRRVLTGHMALLLTPL